MFGGDGVDQGIEVESREIRVFGLDEDNSRIVVPRQVDLKTWGLFLLFLSSCEVQTICFEKIICLIFRVVNNNLTYCGEKI